MTTKRSIQETLPFTVVKKAKSPAELYWWPTRVWLIDDKEHDAAVDYQAHFLDEATADALKAELETVMLPHMTSDVVRVRGTTYTPERKARGLRMPSVDASGYNYSGTTTPADVFEPDKMPVLAALFERLNREERDGDAAYNYVHINYYTPAAHLGWHRDDRDRMVPGSPIASVSLGAKRDFQFRAQKNITGPLPFTGTLTQPLAHGSLLRMLRGTQEVYQHCVPKRAQPHARWNLTFRCFK